MQFLAQAAEATASMAAYGLPGILCATLLGWLTWIGKELVKDIKVLAHRIDGLTRAMLMDMVSRDNVGPTTKAAAAAALASIEARNRELERQGAGN